jgi:hypothetical protein
MAEGGGEREGVRGSKRLQPLNGHLEVHAFLAALAERIALVAAPHPRPSPGQALTLSPQAGRGDPGAASGEALA